MPASPPDQDRFAQGEWIGGIRPWLWLGGKSLFQGSPDFLSLYCFSLLPLPSPFFLFAFPALIHDLWWQGPALQFCIPGKKKMAFPTLRKNWVFFVISWVFVKLREDASDPRPSVNSGFRSLWAVWLGSRSAGRVGASAAERRAWERLSVWAGLMNPLPMPEAQGSTGGVEGMETLFS